MAQRLRFGIDGIDMDKYVRHDGSTTTKTLTIYQQGVIPLVLPLDSLQARSFLAWYEGNSVDAKLTPPKPPPE